MRRQGWSVVWLAAAAVVVSGTAARPGLVTAQQPPIRPNPPLVLESLTGRDSFQFYCAPCHGSDGRGNGPTATALTSRPADLTSLAGRNNGVFPRARIVALVAGGTGRVVPAHGTSEMPVWGPIFRALDPNDARVKVRVDNIVGYIESLQGSAGRQAPTGAELFRTYCASCHGENARGSGPMAGALRRTPPDLTLFAARNGGVFPAERLRQIVDGRTIASHGTGEMPVWGDAFKATRDGFSEASVKARITAIVQYLESVQMRRGD